MDHAIELHSRGERFTGAQPARNMLPVLYISLKSLPQLPADDSSAPLMTSNPSSATVGYLTAENATGPSDYYIDLSKKDPRSHPPDVQAYLECVARWGDKKPNGIVAMDEMDSGEARYKPNLEAIEQGLRILREEQFSESQRPYFFDSNFITDDLIRGDRFYPWRNKLSDDEKDKWLRSAEGELGPTGLDDEFIVRSNMRIPIPMGLTPPDRNKYWVALIGELYGNHHPLFMFANYRWLNSANQSALSVRARWDWWSSSGGVSGPSRRTRVV